MAFFTSFINSNIAPEIENRWIYISKIIILSWKNFYEVEADSI